VWLSDVAILWEVARFNKLRGVVFTALHKMQTRSSDENSVCLYVRLSVKTREL